MPDTVGFNINTDSTFARVNENLALLGAPAPASDSNTVTENDSLAPVSNESEKQDEAPQLSSAYDRVNPLGQWALLTADITQIGLRAGFNRSGIFPMPSIPIPQVSFLNHKVRSNLTSQQETRLRVAELVVGFSDLAVDAFIDGAVIQDSTFTGSNDIPLLPDNMPLAGGMLVFFSDEIGDVTGPFSDILRDRKMNDYTGTNAAINIGQVLHFMLQGMLTADKLQAWQQKTGTAYEYQDDYLADYVIDNTGGYPSGVDNNEYRDDIQKLIEMSQGSGMDAGSTLVYLAYLQEKYGVDFSDKALSQLVSASAQGSQQISPDNSLTGLVRSIGYLAAAQETNLSFVSAFGVHLMLNNMTDQQGVHLFALAVPAANIGINTAKGIALKNQIGTITRDLTATGLGYIAANVAGDDLEMRRDLTTTITQIGPSIYHPKAVTTLVAVDEFGHATNSSGEMIGNPVVGMARWGIITIDSFGNLLAGSVAGKHLMRGLKTKDGKEFLPLAIVLGAQAIETGVYIYLMQPKRLPNGSYAFENELPDGVKVTGNNEGQGNLWTPLAISTSSTAIGIFAPFVTDFIKRKVFKMDTSKKTASDFSEMSKGKRLLFNTEIIGGPGDVGGGLRIRF